MFASLLIAAAPAESAAALSAPSFFKKKALQKYQQRNYTQEKLSDRILFYEWRNPC